MKTIKGIFLSLLTFSPMGVSLSVVSVNSANAQAATQSLAECVKELNDAYPYSVSSDIFTKHTQDCINNLATQTPTESLGQCVARMNKIYPYSVSSDVMTVNTESCNNLLRAQRSNIQQQVQPTSTNPQEFADCVNGQMYKQKEVCIDPWGSIDETCFYGGRGGKRNVSEATGVTIQQARAICGG